MPGPGAARGEAAVALRRARASARMLRRALALTASRGAAGDGRGRVTVYRGPLRDLLADPAAWPEDRHLEVEVTVRAEDL